MEQSDGNCPRCGKAIPNNVLYQCARCFSKYCKECDDSHQGKNCPKCGLAARIVLDQSPK